MLAIICDAITPLLFFALAIFTWRHNSELGKRQFTLLILLETSLGIGVTYSLMGIDHWGNWWPKWGLDYSTHSAFALSLGVPLAKYHHWLWAGVLLFYGLCMQVLLYHSWADMVTTGLAWALFVLPLIHICQQRMIKH